MNNKKKFEKALKEHSQGQKPIQKKGYKYAPVANKLVNKWKNTQLLEGFTARDKGNLAILLENEAQHLINETTYNQGDEGYETVLFSMVRKIFAKLISEQILSVQAMPMRTSLIFYLDAKYGSDNAALGVSAGDDILGSDSPLYNFKGGFSKKYKAVDDQNPSGTLYWCASSAGAYSGTETGFNTVTPSNTSNYVARLQMDSSGFSPECDYSALRNFKFETGATGVNEIQEFFGAKYAKSDSSGEKLYPLVAVSASVPANSNNFETDASDENVKVQYVPKATASSPTTFEYSGTDLSIPEVNIDITSTSVTADDHKLKARWTPEVAQDLSAYHNVDAQTELVNVMSSLVAAEIDQLNIDMLLQSAWNDGTVRYWSDEIGKRFDANGNVQSSTGTFYGTQKDWNQELVTTLMNLSSIIGKKLIFGDANYLVLGPTAGTLLDTLEVFHATEDVEGTAGEYTVGPKSVGTLKGKFKVYKHPYFPEHFVLEGYKGAQSFDTVAIYAPYVPVVFTPTIWDEDNLVPVKGLVTRYGKEIVRSEGLGVVAVDWQNLV